MELRTGHRTRRVDFRLLAEARLVAFVAGATRVGGGGRWKSQNRKNVYLSPCVGKPLNSKVIKSFVPELRSRKCFVFRDSYVLCIYVTNIMNVLCTGMNMSISRISVSWVCNISNYSI